MISSFTRGVGALKREEGTKDDISELKSLIRGHRVGTNSAENPKISGSLADRIAKTLIYGKKRKSDTDREIEKIKKALSDFTKQLRSASDGRGII